MKNARHVPQIADRTKNCQWYHGSPIRLTRIRSGSTITHIRTLARAFSHKPSRVRIDVEENEETGSRTIMLTQDGTRNGYLYLVILDDPDTDIREDPESVMFPLDEVLTTRELAVELLEEVPLKRAYSIHTDL